MVALVSVVGLAFVMAYLVVNLLACPGGRLRVLDHPTERSLHSTPIPRTGGLAIWAGSLAGVLIALLLFGRRLELEWMVGAALIVGIVSFIDDRFRVSPFVRLMAHLIAGGLLLVGGFGLQSISLPGIELNLPPQVGLLVSILFIVWMTNLYNFMDGMDGFAGGMAVFGFGTLGTLAYLAGDAHFVALCWLVAASAGGFLVLNFPPARIFMGDNGASVLGLTAAALSLWGNRIGAFPLWIAVLVFSPFAVDATVTLFWRAMRGERVWEAHRSHYYQRLVQLGWGHKKTVLAEYGLMTLCAISGVTGVRLSVFAQWAMIVFWIAAYACLILAIERFSKRPSCKESPR